MTITQPLGLAVIHASGVTPVSAVLVYDQRDPYAVLLDIEDGGGAHTWAFARNLLADGISAPGDVGEGDVKIMRHEDGTVFIAFSSDQGAALAEADPDDIDAFLTKSYTAVPEGTEREHLAIDAGLAALFGEAA
ncbi:SsgA family sporulation/cell division regulator [Streptomyces atriruber]|uniref:SsgA family sporulation/cell division regulator n=1 Tax=Streptomyces atriruber TaxID=545121 RepID=UPI0007C7C2FF|nr:SsgA family sporulation/cell division regulator [Streptomyces atriruber]